MKKIALFVFNGDPMCFIHVLLNALDMKQKGYEARIIIEGAATQLIPELEKKGHPLHQLWKQARAEGLIEEYGFLGGLPKIGQRVTQV